MKALVACEESQAVCIELRKLGWEAYSCDIQECSGGHPEWHICEDVIPLVNGACVFRTMDGQMHSIQGRWDLIIAHPPCTYLTVTGNRWFNVERYGEKAIQRAKDREEAVEFFMVFANADCEHICIENPVGCMSTRWRKADQIINPTMLVLPESCTHDDYMNIDLMLLDLADAIYMLKGWEKSKGACIEYGYARAKNKMILMEK
jgi:hypothetical protein